MMTTAPPELDWTTLVTRVYPELRRVARALLASERRGHTLQPTALVHEALAALLDVDRPIAVSDDRHFIRLAVSRMRRQLIDHARKRLAAKRQPGTEIGDGNVLHHRMELMVTVDQLLGRLRRLDERSAEVMELFYFGGLGDAEIAAVLGLSERTVARDREFARAVLCSLMQRD